MQRAEGHDAHLRIRILQERLDRLLAGLAEAGQQPDGAGSHIRILILEQAHQRLHGLVAVLEDGLLGRAAEVDRRALERGQGAIERVEAGRRHLRAEALRRDAIDGARGGLVPIGMTADAGVEPVGHVHRPVGADRHIAGAEHDLEALIATGSPLEVGAGIVALGIAGQEVEALELEVGSVGLGQVAEDDIAARFAAQQQAAVLLTQRSVFVEGDARRRTAPVHVARRHRARVFLTPLGHRRALARTPIGAPGALAVERAEPGIAVFHQEGRAAGRRIVVVVLEDIAIRGDGLLVAVAEVVADDVHARTVGIHAGGEAPDPHVAVVALLAGDLRRVPAQLGAPGVVGAADAEGLARTVGEHRPAIAGVPVPLAVRTHGHAVDGVVMALAVEPGQDDLALVHRGIELPVAIDVGVDDHVGRHRYDHLVADHRHAHRGAQGGLLHKHALLVGHAIPIRILEDDDPVTRGLAVVMPAVIDPFGHPDPALRVEVEVGRILQHRGRSPDGDFQVGIGHLEQAGRHGRLGSGGPSGQGQSQGKAIERHLHRQVVPEPCPKPPISASRTIGPAPKKNNPRCCRSHRGANVAARVEPRRTLRSRHRKTIGCQL